MIKRFTLLLCVFLTLSHCALPSASKQTTSSQPPENAFKNCATDPCLCPDTDEYQAAKNLLYKNEIIINGQCLAQEELTKEKERLDCLIDPCACKTLDQRADQVISVIDTARWSDSGLHSENILINIPGALCAANNKTLKELVCEQLSSAAGCPSEFASSIDYQEACIQTPALCAKPTIQTQVLFLDPIGSLTNADDINKERPLVCKRNKNEDQSWSTWETVQTGYVAEHPDLPDQPGGQMTCNDETMIIYDPEDHSPISLNELYQYLQDQRTEAGQSAISTVSIQGVDHRMTLAASYIQKIIDSPTTKLSNNEILSEICPPDNTSVSVQYHLYDNGSILTKTQTLQPFNGCMDEPTKANIIAQSTCALDICECSDDISQKLCAEKQAASKASAALPQE